MYVKRWLISADFIVHHLWECVVKHWTSLFYGTEWLLLHQRFRTKLIALSSCVNNFRNKLLTTSGTRQNLCQTWMDKHCLVWFEFNAQSKSDSNVCAEMVSRFWTNPRTSSVWFWIFCVKAPSELCSPSLLYIQGTNFDNLWVGYYDNLVVWFSISVGLQYRFSMSEK